MTDTTATLSPRPAPTARFEAGGTDLADPTPFVQRGDDGTARLDLVLENVDCPSCIQTIEQSLLALSGVTAARVNFSTRRLAVAWRDGALTPISLLETLAARGYRAMPFRAESLAALQDNEDRALLRALAVSGFASANIMLLSVSVWSGLASDMGEATRGLFHWISALIAVPAVAYAGRPFYRSAWSAVRRWSMNMDVPITLAVILALAMSLYQTMTAGEQVYFDASVMLLFFLLIGRYLDRRLRSRARSAAQNLLALRASAATIVDPDGTRRALPIEAVRPGMRVAVAAGERIPVDGSLAGGQTELDTSLITGEAMPRAVRTGNRVFAGTVNLGGPIEIAVTAIDEQTLLAEIVRLMEAAEQGRARYVRLADRAAKIYAPVVHLLAAGTFLAWFLPGFAAWDGALLIAIAVLIITCPCALGLAVPAVQVVASGRLLRRGILVKSGDGLERLAAIDAVVFDKTGTITDGQLELLDRDAVDAAALHDAASLAGVSRHPLSRAITRAAGSVPTRPDIHEEPGMGLSAPVAGGEMRLGSRAWCDITDNEAGDGETYGPALWLTRPGAAPVCFRFRDQLRPDARAVMDRLKAKGIDLMLLSGDQPAAVQAVADAVGIDHWDAGLRPDDKIQRIAAMLDSGQRVLMVGDGLNDAPALAAAHASLSPSSAADVSQTAADIVFQGQSLWPVIEALETAQAARRLVFENFGLALIYNIIAIPVAVLGLVTPLIAAVAMSASSIVVTANALRLGAQRLAERS